MKKNIVIITHTFAIGGAESHISNIANYLATHNINVTVLLLDNSTIAYKLDDSIRIIPLDTDKDNELLLNKIISKILKKININTYNIYEFYLYIKLMYSNKLKKLINKDDIIVSFMPIPTFSSLIANKKLKNKLVFFEFSNPEIEYNTKEKKYILNKFIQYSDIGIFQTEDEMRYYDFTDKIKKKVIPNPLYSSLLPSPYSGKRRKEIVNFCRIEQSKNLNLLVDAFELLHNEYDDYKLSIYGNGSKKKELQEYIIKKNLEDCILLLDARPDIHKCIIDCEMFVSSSSWEGISNSMLEAMAIGLPCICTDCPAGGARMMIENYENGILVPVDDKQKMYEAMKEIIENPALSEKLSKNAVKIRERLEPDKICSQIANAIFD